MDDNEKLQVEKYIFPNMLRKIILYSDIFCKHPIGIKFLNLNHNQKCFIHTEYVKEDSSNI